MQNREIIIFCALIVLLVVYKCCNLSEKFTNLQNNDYMFYKPEIKQQIKPVKKQIKNPVSEKFIFTRPNKCFSCEKEILENYSKEHIHLAFPGKCFSCENEAKKNGTLPYNEGPTKCFSCKK